MTPLWVAGMGVFAPGLPTWSVAEAVFRGDQPWTPADVDLPAPLLLPKNERRRASPTIRLALEVVQQATTSSGMTIGQLSSVFGSSSGDGDVLNAILEVVTGVEPRVSPTLFHNSVHNAAAGYWSIGSGSHEPSLSIGAFD